ncbi:hypothetical protein IEO70_01100 [Bacillus sp. AGMB 02131]|uniref:Uncharacterized protein n=1 Tax=Peribacillus faecalis TaxID=2772559 RepID=A0A927CVZ9_9BACI|nr:hypothetical protein [Peribacillus faecalis]MBD3106975.1 hypothetical protein [Peribacillus faecalis]
MKKYYMAVTYDVCEQQGTSVDMNEYEISCLEQLYEQVKKIALADVAPIVKVFESDYSTYENAKLYTKFKFPEYECACGK